MNNNNQSDFFDKTNNQYSQNKILHPPLSQMLEITHLIKLLQLSPPKKILDFGAGNGRTTIPLLERGFDVWAFDISEKSLKTLEIIYQQQKQKYWGKLTILLKLPKLPKQLIFDAIVGSDILHHVDIKDYLPKLYRILTSRGIIVFSEPNAWHLLWYFFIFLKLDWNIEKGILQCFAPQLESSLRLNKFKAIKIIGHGLFPTSIFNFFPFMASFNALRLGNLPLLKLFAFRLIISAKKP